MTTPLVAVDHDEAEPDPTCWCCGRSYPENQLVRLGTHPEVGVCFQCAKFPHRRAREQHDDVSDNHGLAARGRVVFANGREVVLRHEWQNGRISGPILHWINRVIP